MSTVQDASSVSSLFGAGTTAAASSTVQETEDRFLALLVAQMKNQDPLNPLDNAEVTSQMAQLSTVQGIEDMNATLEALSASMGVNQMAQAANLIGSAVLVPGNRISPVQGGQPVDSTALHLGLVNSVSQNSQGVQLNLAGNESVTYADIRQI